ncbi:MAG TPA: Gfo/Idh/MocA family oxidoreductase [Planctomycetota bacterium]|nr:Gfo/Idh/MocA family oxidoreductase [Planctomycetota bacterium]HRR80866.1 Gfo/Idh/MocA family oxidoreductase [Planctomycetota bacterium]HRT94727.1 Gfo/Idh/MocA family oxidoreductase [Planctomycetota bacterium]
MRKGKVGFAIVGCGVIGPWHAKAIQLAPKCELIALCDIEIGKARALAAEYGNVPCYADHRTMLKREPDIDCVCACVPSGLHWRIAVDAAKAGRHVLSEKPLDITLAHMDRMIEACAKARVKLGCIFQRRTTAMTQVARKIVQQGKLGKLVLADCYMKYYRSPAYYKSAGWRGTWELDGGGALMNQGVHGIDQLLYVAGEVESVTAHAAPLVRDIPVEDTAVAILRFRSGAFGVLEGTTSVTPGMSTRTELHGENGTLIFNDSGLVKYALAKEKAGVAQDVPLQIKEPAPTKSAASDPKALSVMGHMIQVQDMANAILKDREPMVPGPEARKAVELILAIYKSSRTGKTVTLPLG